MHNKMKHLTKCPICQYVHKAPITQCQNCGTLFVRNSIWHKINIFGRLDELEKQNKKLQAAFMKLAKITDHPLTNLQ